jgi:hypothetical protein
MVDRRARWLVPIVVWGSARTVLPGRTVRRHGAPSRQRLNTMACRRCTLNSVGSGLPTTEDESGDDDTTPHDSHRHDERDDHHSERHRCYRYGGYSNPNPCNRDPFTCVESAVHGLPP